MAALLIRDSAPADLASIQEIYAWHVLNGLASFEEVAPDRTEMTHRREDVLARGLPHLVADDGVQVIGYSYAGPYRSRSAYRYSVENSVYVQHDTIHRGVGRALLSELIARCQRIGLRQMVAVIGDSGNAASIGLHAALGFRMVGVLESVGFKHRRWVDSVIMQRGLGDDGCMKLET
jgi:phosphinothricin acetyltransferase